MNFTFLMREHLSLKVTNSFMNHYFIDIEFAKLFLSLWYDDDTSDKWKSETYSSEMREMISIW